MPILLKKKELMLLLIIWLILIIDTLTITKEKQILSKNMHKIHILELMKILKML